VLLKYSIHGDKISRRKELEIRIQRSALIDLVFRENYRNQERFIRMALQKR
jgi:hypothetical protein